MGSEGSASKVGPLASRIPSDCVIEITDLASNTVVGKGRATRERADLKKLGYGRSNFAFHIVLNPTSGELGALRVTADGVELGGSPFRADAGRYHGALEVAAGSIRGWVADAFKRTRPPAVSFFDQERRIIGELSPAPDGAEPDAPMLFDFPVPARCYGREELTISGMVGDAEFARAHCDLRLDGFLDVLSPQRCAGWLVAPTVQETGFQIRGAPGTGRLSAPGDASCRGPICAKYTHTLGRRASTSPTIAQPS